MNRFIRWSLHTLAGLGALPGLIAVADMWTWILFDHTLSSIQWGDLDSGRLGALWLLLFMATVVNGIALALKKE